MGDESGAVVLLERPEPRIALVTLNRPDARNAINGEVARALQAAVATIEQDPELWVAVLTGAGPHAFCAGADLKAVASGRSQELSTDEGGFAGFVHIKRSKPWIAAAQGHALAGGLEILLACDLAIAAETATFGLPEVKRSLIAAAGRALPTDPRRAPGNRLANDCDRQPDHGRPRGRVWSGQRGSARKRGGRCGASARARPVRQRAACRAGKPARGASVLRSQRTRTA